MNEHDSNPFRPPTNVNSRRQASSFAYLFACLLWCGLAIKMIVIRPIISSFFEEFELQVPVLTRWLLNPASTVFFVGIAAGVLTAGLVVTTSEGRRRVGWRALLLALVTIIVLLIGLGLPVLRLIDALSGP